MNDAHFIGIDAGNSGIKFAYFRNSKICYGFIPNINGPAIHLDILPVSIRDEEIISVQVISAENFEQREQMFIGELAIRQLQEHANQDRNRNKVDSDSVNIIVPAVLGIIDIGKPIVLCVGATLQDYAIQAPALQKRLTKKHEVRFQFGSKANQIIKPEVIKTYTYAQAAAGLYGMLRTDEGKITRADWSQSTILALDFGHGQINVAVMENMQFIKQACFSIDYGFYRIVNAVQQYLNTNCYVSATIPQLQKTVENGFYLRHGKEIDLKDIIDKNCAQLMDMLYRELVSQIPAVLYDKITSVVCLGGGAKVMLPFVGARMGIKPELSENSLFANARGLLWIAREKWEKEHGLG